MAKFDMDWGTIPEPGTGSNVDFMKLQSGQNVIRIVGRPSLIDIHWEKAIDGTTKKVICPGAGCPLCKAGHQPQARYQVKVIDRAVKDEVKVKILEGGPTIFNSIKSFAMDPDYGDPTRYDVKISKSGTGRETKYTVLAAPKQSELSKAEATAVEESKTVEEINKPKTIEEIMQMGLEVLVGSVGDLSEDDGFEGNSSNDVNVTDDDWNSL